MGCGLYICIELRDALTNAFLSSEVEFVLVAAAVTTALLFILVETPSAKLARGLGEVWRGVAPNAHDRVDDFILTSEFCLQQAPLFLGVVILLPGFLATDVAASLGNSPVFLTLLDPGELGLSALYPLVLDKLEFTVRLATLSVGAG